MDAVREPRALEYGLALASPLWLVLGALAPANAASTQAGLRGWRSWLRPGAWLLGFPGAIGTSCAARGESWNELYYGTLGIFCFWLLVCAYGASAAALCTQPALRVPVVLLPLEPEKRAGARRGAAWSQQAWKALCVGGAVTMTVVAPMLGGLPALERDFGTAATTGGVLTALVGGALGISTVALFLGQAMRDRAPLTPAPRKTIWRRALLFAALAALGAATYRVLGS